MASDERESAASAEYMELRGAKKDGDCTKVKVDGGVSLDLGCCDRFKPKAANTQRFRCEDCRFHTDGKGHFFG